MKNKRLPEWLLIVSMVTVSALAFTAEAKVIESFPRSGKIINLVKDNNVIATYSEDDFDYFSIDDGWKTDESKTGKVIYLIRDNRIWRKYYPDEIDYISIDDIERNSEYIQKCLYDACCSSMSSYYDDFEHVVQGIDFNGEASFRSLWGDVIAQDYFSWLWAGYTGTHFLNWESMNNPDSWVVRIPWLYCLSLIDNANALINEVEEADIEDDEYRLVKAEALTLRAHGYFNLLQLFAPRWADSDNGTALCPTGVDESRGIIRYEPMKSLIATLNSNLDEAISLFGSTTLKRKNLWEPDIDVARGVYARIAMLCQDYRTAQRMAHEARLGYPIMSSKDFKSGFCDPNGEWMWCSEGSESLYYKSFGAWFACNGPYTVWDMGAGAINYELYRRLSQGDIRAGQFFTPDKLLKFIPRTLQPASFWKKEICDPATMSLANNINMIILYRKFGKTVTPERDDIKWFAPYAGTDMQSECKGIVFFGSQYKFWGKDRYGTGSYCYMRGAEMLLIEAEAAVENKDYTTARNNLNELYARRFDEVHTCTADREDLREEVRLNRRIELWGEGFNFFDLKRWNVPMVREPWIEGDVESNNIPDLFAITRYPEDNNKWTFAVPSYKSEATGRKASVNERVSYIKERLSMPANISR